MPFHIVQGDGLILIGNDAMYKSDLLNSKEVLVIPPNVGNLASVQLTLPIYNVDIDGVVRTFLMVVPSQKNVLGLLLISQIVSCIFRFS